MATAAKSEPIPVVDASLTCPHCGTTRPDMEQMGEHLDARHSDVKKTQGSTQIIPGTGNPMTDYVQAMERMASTYKEMRPALNPNSETDLQFAGAFSDSPVWRDGQKVPEHMFMWDKEARRRRVKSQDSFKMMITKGWTAAPPDLETYNEFWFHWRCPLTRCRDHKDYCHVHGEPGTDSNHPLMNPVYMMLHHLQHGDRAHRMYFEMNKDELKKQFAHAFGVLSAEEEIEKKRMHDAQEKAEAALMARAQANPQQLVRSE